jgi:hypothetical protein
MAVAVMLTGTALSAQASIGESRAQIEARFGRNALVKSDTGFAQYENKNIATIFFGDDGRSNLEIYSMHSRFSKADADQIWQTVIRPTRRLQWDKVTTDAWMTHDKVYSMVFLQHGPSVEWVVAVGYTDPVIALVRQWGKPKQEIAKAAPTQQPARSERRDCAIVAAEQLARLKPNVAWARVVSYSYTYIGKDGSLETDNHAEVAFKYEADGHVFISDADGAIELNTTAEDTDTIKALYQQRLNAVGVQMKVSDFKFLTK